MKRKRCDCVGRLPGAPHSVMCRESPEPAENFRDDGRVDEVAIRRLLEKL
jgi:hypothetical protein